MDLDRGALAKLDRRILSGLDRNEHSQMVRVPVSETVWSTWRRYCKTVGVAMGRGVAGLIVHELRTVEGSTTGGAEPGSPSLVSWSGGLWHVPRSSMSANAVWMNENACSEHLSVG